MRAVSLLGPLALVLMAQVPTPAPYRNAMPAFWRFAESAEHVPEEQVPALFQKHLVEAHPELFVSGVLGDPKKNPQRWEELSRDYWRKVRPLLPRIRTAEHELGSVLASSEGLFRQHFPEFRLEVKLLVAPSMFEWDGTVRKVSDETAMLFAPDGIASIHGDAAPGRLRPLVIHELFHTQHEFEGESPPDVLTMLWREGLASYASHALLPEAKLEDVLLSQELAHLSGAQEARLARKVLARLTRNDDKARGPFFNYAREPLEPGIPPRAGYLLGYRVAQRLAKTKTLQQLSLLQRAELEPLLRQALRDLARSR